MRRTRRTLLAVAVVALACSCSSSDDVDDDDGGDLGPSLDGLTFTEKYTCNQTFTGAEVTCPDVDEEDQLQFTASGDGYEVRDIPDNGFVYRGRFDGDVFEWSATSPDGYGEVGTWTFGDARTEFSGSSTYAANDLTYEGECNVTGVQGVATPTPPLGCP